MLAKENELSAFVKEAIKDIQSGFQGTQYELPEAINFELSVTKVKNTGGGVRIIVAEANGKYEKQTLSKISFSSKIFSDHYAVKVRKTTKMLDFAHSIEESMEKEDLEEKS